MQEQTLPPSSVEKRNFFSRLGGVYLSPGETFRGVGQSPGVLWPILASVIFGLLVGFYVSRALDIQSLVVNQLQTLVDQGRMTKEQMQQSLPLAGVVAKVQVYVSPVSSILVSLVIAAVFKLITTLVGAENRFSAVFSVTLYAMLAVSIIQTVLFALVLHFKGPGEVTASNINSLVVSNLGAVLSAVSGDSLPKFVLRLAGWVDIFAAWRIALLSIGYAAVSRKLKVSKAVAWLTGAYALIALVGSLFSSLTS